MIAPGLLELSTLSFVVLIVLIVPEKKKEELTRVPMFVIQFSGSPKFWICESRSENPFGVTFRFSEASRFLCQEDARHEMLRLGLSGEWRVVPV